MVKSSFSFEDLSKKLQEFGVPEKQAGELGFHFVEVDTFALKFREVVNDIVACKENEKEKVKNLLGDLRDELEHHIVTNHLIPAKKLLDDITNKLEDKK